MYRFLPVLVGLLSILAGAIHFDICTHGPNGWAVRVVGEQMSSYMIAGKFYDFAVGILAPLQGLLGFFCAIKPRKWPVKIFWGNLLIVSLMNSGDVVSQILQGERRIEDVVMTAVTLVAALLMVVAPCPYPRQTVQR